jgi:hypothetical protein
MRTEILDYINTLNLGSFLISQELPWEESGTALYLKNLKKIYVDAPQYQNETLIAALNGLNINNETSVVRILFACDAKQTPANYEALVTDLKSAKDITTIEVVRSRQCDVSTDIENDALVTTLEIRFTKITT